jgi:1-acyl-sn-glycerol-3-phosphate acyltransferase
VIDDTAPPATASGRTAAGQPILDTITPWMRGLAAATRVLLAGLTRVRIEGAAEFPTDGPLIVAANHASNLDAVVLGSSLMPRLDRRFQWLGKKELFGWPIVGWIARNGGVHPVDRSTADVEAYRLARRILDEGHVLFAFPEGTRSPDGSLQEARDGVAVLALRTGAPIVPIGVAGSHRVWPRSQRLPHPGGHVTVRVGRPFRLAEVLPADLDRKAAKGVATDAIMRRIAELLPPGQRGAYEGRNGDPVP